MKITLEPTSTANFRNHTVIIAHPHDDLTVEQVVDLLRQALIAYGYHHENVNDATGLTDDPE